MKVRSPRSSGGWARFALAVLLLAIIVIGTAAAVSIDEHRTVSTIISSEVGVPTAPETIQFACGDTAEPMMLSAATGVSSGPLPDYRDINVYVANGAGVKHDVPDGVTRYPNIPYNYVEDTYFILCGTDGGGLNPIHISTHPTDPPDRKGDVTTTTAQSGTFYITFTGGQPTMHNAILMLAVNGTIPDDFAVHIRSSGYEWDLPPPGVGNNLTDIAPEYIEGAIDETFGKSDFRYGPQIWRPCSLPDYPIHAEQDMSDTENTFQLMFIDLRVGALQTGIDSGAIKVEYSFENLDTFAAFDVYGWYSVSNHGTGIIMTNCLTENSKKSGYAVQGIRQGGSGTGCGGSDGGSGSSSSSGGSGIWGGALNTSTVGSLNGTVQVYPASGPAEPLTAGSSAEIQFPVTLPTGATVDRVLLSVYLSDVHETETGTGTPVRPAFRFDGKPVTPATVAWDRQGTDPSAPLAGTVTLAIPPALLSSGDHTLTVRGEGEQKVTYRVPGALLVVVVSDPTQPRLDYWLADGCDDILADLWEGTTAEDAATKVKFDEPIDREQASAGRLYVVSTAAPDQATTGTRVLLNTWDWLNPLQEGPTGVWTAALDALPFLQDADNTVAVQSYPVGVAGAHLQTRNALLVVRYGAEDASPGLEIADVQAPPEEEIGAFVLPDPATGVGMLENESCYRTDDQHLTLRFPAGCRVTNSTGAAVTGVTVHAVRDLPPPPGMAMDRVYRIAPEDARAGIPFSITAQAPGNATWYRYDTNKSIWHPVATNLSNGEVTAHPDTFGTYGVATPLPASLAVSSNPAGARIHLDGVYLGKVTPALLSPVEPGNHTIRLDLDRFGPYETTVTVPADTAVFGDLMPAGFPGLARLKFDETLQEPEDSRTGGVYVMSRPPGATVIVDGKTMPFVTPHVVQGIREGSHQVQVVKEGQAFNTPTRTVWVERDCITPVLIDAHEQAIVRKVALASEEYAGKGCTLNGRGPVFRLPRTLAVAGGNAFVTINDGDGDWYLSHRVMPTEEGETITIPPRDAPLCGLFVESDPAGAEILVDGFRTGFCTPYLIRNVSDGSHIVSVTRPGYLPAEQEVRLTDDRNAEIDKRVAFHLEPYPYGSLNLTSEPSGAEIYLYNKNTGEVTPHTFRYMPIGTYEVKVVGNATFRTADDVTVRPYEVTGRAFDLV